MIDSRKVRALLLVTAVTLMFQNCGKLQPYSQSSIGSSDEIGQAVTYDGAKLYASSCALCHSSLSTSTKLDRTSTQIIGALQSVPSMAHLQGLTAGAVEAIARALKVTAIGPQGNPYVCNPMAQPAPNRLQRLAKSEYVNTIRDLFAGTVTLAELTDEINLIPEEINQGNPFDRGADSMNLGLVQAQNRVAKRIGDLLILSPAKLNAVFSEACLAQATVTDACLNTFIDRFGLKAYRRPVKAAERVPLIAAYRLGASSTESSAYLLRALLMAPNFTYHLEYDGAPTDANITSLQLNAYELASRLSYLIVNTMPDDALLAAAGNNTLMTAIVLDSQINRLLAMPAARTSFRRFFYQWFEFGRMKEPAYSTAVRGNVNTTGLNQSAVEEAMLFSDHIVFENKKLAALLTDNTAFVRNATIAQLYGVGLPAAADGRTVLPPGERSGMLTRLAKTLGGNDTTSPVQRGVVVRRSLLCDEIAQPNPNALPPGSLDLPPEDPLLSTRKRYENKTSPVQCTACHSAINPIGFAFENYDSLGRFRTVERIFNAAGTLVAQHPIDAQTTVASLTTPDPLVNGGLQISSAIADSPKFSACFSRRWFQFSIRRTATPLDGCVLSNTFDAVKNPNASLLEAIKSTINSSEFRMRRMK